MNKDIINILMEVCKSNEEYTLIYTPAHDRIAVVCTEDFDNEILCIEKVENNIYKFESDKDTFTDTNIDCIISAIYITLINLTFDLITENLNIDNIKDFDKIIKDINVLRDKYC